MLENLLEKANSLVKGQGDGRISDDDIKEILEEWLK